MTDSRRRGRGERVQRFRVHLTIEEARELRSLLRDDDGDADEGLLDDVYDVLRGDRHPESRT